jgi:phosphoglycolate phosphatase
MSRPTVLLFDVDGTLVTTGGAGRRALERTFERLYGRNDACANMRFDGMTDRAIVRGGLTAIDLEATDALIEQVLAAYVAVLVESVAQVEDARYRLHPGMVDAIEAGHAAGFAVGLGTGNIREGARVKLARVGVADRFAFGGFGDDHESRPELIRIGAQRGAQHLGVALEDARVVVIGDTTKDIAAAQALGAECVAVGTGVWTVEQLQQAGATRAYATLADAGALDFLLGRRGREPFP